MGIDPRLSREVINRDPHRRQVEPFVVSGKTQTGEWINRLYRRVLALEDGMVLDPNAPPPAKYETGNLPLTDAPKRNTNAASLPSLGNLKFQRDYNHWLYGVLGNESQRVDQLIEQSKDWATQSWVQSWVAQYYAPIDHKHPEYGGGSGGDVDLSGYATEAWVTEKFAAIDHEHEGLATEEWVLEQIPGSAEGGGPVKTSQVFLENTGLDPTRGMPLETQKDVNNVVLDWVINKIPFVRTEDTPWPNPIEGQTWMDPQAMQQMVWWRGQWVPSSPAYGGGGAGDGWKHLPDLPDLMDAAQPVAKVYGKRKG